MTDNKVSRKRERTNHLQNNDDPKSAIFGDIKFPVSSPSNSNTIQLENPKTHRRSSRLLSLQQQSYLTTLTPPSGSKDKVDHQPQRQIPEVISKRRQYVDVWLNMVYKEEATSRTRNTQFSVILSRMRTIVIDWIREVCEVYRHHRNTYHLAVDYIDRYLVARPTIPKTEIQLLGITCVYIAAKFEEVHPPRITEYSYVCDGACTVDAILTCELLVLYTLGWDVNPMTATGWLNLYMQIHSYNVASTQPKHRASFQYPVYSAYQFTLASHILNLFTMDPWYVRFSYSVISASAMYLVCGKEAALAVSGFHWNQIELCAAWMRAFYEVLCVAKNPQLLTVCGKRLYDGFFQEKMVQPMDFKQNCIDMGYYEEAILLHLRWFGFAVKKMYGKQTEQNIKMENDQSTSVIVYELERIQLDGFDRLTVPLQDVPTSRISNLRLDIDHVNIFLLPPQQKICLNWDVVTASVYRDCTDSMILDTYRSILSRKKL